MRTAQTSKYKLLVQHNLDNLLTFPSHLFSNSCQVTLWRDLALPAVLELLDMLMALAIEENIEEQVLSSHKDLNLAFLCPGEMFSLTIKADMQNLPVFCRIVFKNGTYTVDSIIGLKEWAAENSMCCCVAVSPFKKFPF